MKNLLVSFMFAALAAVQGQTVVATAPMSVVSDTKTSVQKVVDAKFIAMSSALIGATMFDMETTFAGVRAGTSQEANPVMKPFISAGRPATYALLGAADAFVIHRAYKAKKAGSKYWWLLPAIATGGHAFAGGMNLRFVF